MADDAPLVGVLVDFAAHLRRAGLAIGSGDVLTYCAALAPLDPTDLLDLYWAGRTTMVTRHDQLPVYDRVFRQFFLDEGEALPEPVRLALRAGAETRSVLQVPATEPGTEDRNEQQAQLGLVGSDAEVLRHKAFAACTPEELAGLRRIVARLRLAPPRRRTRRTAAARDGRTPDPRRTVRAMMRDHGELSTLHWRRRRLRQRPLILIVDVSGSMADYSRSLLQFAYSARRATARVEAFCFGTRLTRITRALERRRVDDALAQAARAVFDWEGGTRIGASLDEFVRDWGRRGVCRGGIVVICSDGLDRGDPQMLATATERLARLSHRVVWLNPHKGGNRTFQPSTLGMMVVAPYVDTLLSGHNLHSLEEFAALLPELS
ncbi:vWA domain-containing protein [Planosporangium mesophilum]|uniref:VWA domain-containing protein n=1 Tax=Planosporangium mesophilum TaxID=689768 RepID=A0A8J3TCF9_9ACTN|nr:VWA domain-containing protein [Planosporangium mesophilum]NJC84526.1 VWA domain-containing protein [Planosporangium mesophilum]GII23327.1 VWA domain-containing protein [Planosporangium mesophilum]